MTTFCEHESRQRARSRSPEELTELQKGPKGSKNSRIPAKKREGIRRIVEGLELSEQRNAMDGGRHLTLLHWEKGNKQDSIDTSELPQQRNAQAKPPVIPQPIISQPSNGSTSSALAFSIICFYATESSPLCSAKHDIFASNSQQFAEQYKITSQHHHHKRSFNSWVYP
uniref:Uncharacterized protein n=1 Tax=Glossina pallidipes TaxID=7398 RepID=A0A1A9Z250_GLOPL